MSALITFSCDHVLNCFALRELLADILLSLALLPGMALQLKPVRHVSLLLLLLQW